MKKTVLMILFVLAAITVKAQSPDTPLKRDSAIFRPVDLQATYPGGLFSFLAYIDRNKRSTGDVGLVKVSFIIEKDGSITGITILKSLSKGADKEAIRLIAGSPRWKPAMLDGKPVPSKFTVPISFL